MTTPSRAVPTRWLPRLSLRTLLLFTLTTGVLAGMFGPAAARTLRAHLVTPAPPAVECVLDESPCWSENNGYYESAESPLK